MLAGDIVELLSRQIELLGKAISDLEGLEQELPSYRRAELSSVIGRLTAALADDCTALTALSGNDARPPTLADDLCGAALAAEKLGAPADPDAARRRDRRLASMLGSTPPEHSLKKH